MNEWLNPTDNYGMLLIIIIHMLAALFWEQICGY